MYDHFETGKIVTISTAHLKPETREFWDDCLLDTNGCFGTYDYTLYAKGGYGYFLYPENIVSEETVQDIIDILQFAHAVNADIVCLDADGPRVSGLATYDD